MIDIPFLPLGREPKLFDAFYIGCPEAFSKKNASVRICLQALDSATESLTAVALGTSPFVLLFGVGGDGQLHRVFLSFDPATPLVRLSAVRPPFTDTGVPSVPAPAATINQPGPSLLSAVSVSDLTLGERALVGVTAGNDCWIWSQNVQAGASRWHLLGPIFDLANGPVPTSDDKARVVLLATSSGVHVVGLNQGVLYETHLGANWETSSTRPQWKAVPVRHRPDKRLDTDRSCLRELEVGVRCDICARMGGR